MEPKIFIGSSVEGLRIAESIGAALDYDAEMHQWTNAFPVGGTTLQSLLDKFARCDLAIFLMSPDDVSVQREKEMLIARDNVLFEAGLFMGMHGADRVFLVTPRNVDGVYHVPTDLGGFTPAVYDAERAKKEPAAAVAKAVHEIKSAIAANSWQSERVELVREQLTYEPDMTYKIKLHFRVVNNTIWPVLVRSVAFDYRDQPSPTFENVYGRHGRVHKPEFRRGMERDGTTDRYRDRYRSQAYIEPGKEVEAWVAFQLSADPAEQAKTLRDLLGKHRLAEWTYTCSWNGGRERTVTHKF